MDQVLWDKIIEKIKILYNLHKMFMYYVMDMDPMANLSQIS